MALVGTSGCGKSTLLSIVAGLESHDEGRSPSMARPIDGPGLDRGVVFQSYTLLPWLTARQNVEFALQAAGKPRAKPRIPRDRTSNSSASRTSRTPIPPSCPAA